MQVTAGPDGYLVTSEAEDFAAQARITEYLSACQAQGDKMLETALPQLRRMPKREVVALIRAIHARIAWIAEHERELAEPARWQRSLALLARNLYSPALPFCADDLICLLMGHRNHQALWSFGPEELVVAFHETHDLPPALADELRLFQAALTGLPGGMKYQNQASYQSAVRQIHMLLWHDESEPLDPARCWSEVIRRDLRAMTGERRAQWQALFRHIKGNAPTKPAKGWIREAEKRLAALGIEEFRQRFRSWFAPLCSGEPQPLSVPGSHVLRGLLWYAGLARDPELAQLALGLLDTKWKAKRNVDKAMVALVSVLETMPPPAAWAPLLRLQQEWPTTSDQVERLLKDTAAQFGITEEELKARALLKPRLDIGEQAARMMEKLGEMRAMVLVGRPRG